jgi:universal stress protein A
MNVKKILFPTDFSHAGDAALSLATSLARDSGATLLIAHVEEPLQGYAGTDMYYGMPEPVTDDLKKLLDDVVPTDPAVAYEHRLLEGSPAQVIANLAESENVDLIVMGTHGRGGLTRLLMGSVAEAVVRRAPCPVLTYKQPSEKAVKVG